MKKVNIYIDGFNLFYGLKSLNKKNLYWLDLEKLSLNIIKNHLDFELNQIYYFTAFVKDPDKRNRHELYTNTLTA